MSVDIEFRVENAEEVKKALRSFPNELKESLYRSYLRSANKQEKILKATTGFRDRTGHLRRTLIATASYNPLAITIAALADYARYVAYGHGTWKGNWWLTFLRGAIPQIVGDAEKALEATVKRFNRLMGRTG